MVKNNIIRSVLSFSLVTSLGVTSAFAQGKTPAKPTNPGTAQKIRLSQKDVAELVLKQGTTTTEVNLQYLQNRLAPALALSAYDWKFLVESGFEKDRSQSFSPALSGNSTYERYRTTATLQKPLLTGTLLGVEINRLSQKSNLGDPANPNQTVPTLPEQTQDNFGITLEQSLLGNFFGVADRATVNAAETTFRSNDILRANALEDVVLNTIRLFWDTYVAQENFTEAIASRDRYSKLVSTVRRKSSLGYSNPGELSQAQAEYEGKEQTVKSSSVDYLKKLEALVTTLGLPAGTEIDFIVTEAIPTAPQLPGIDIEKLRSIRSQKLKVEAAQDSYTASVSKSYPTVNLVGKAYTTGMGDTSQTSYTEAVSGYHPKYYVGVKVAYNFGSGYQTEDIINKKVTKELEEARLRRQLLEANDQELQAQRKVQSAYAIAQSAVKQREFRDKAVQELNRTYNQGRTDIKTFIDALNNYFAAQVQFSRAIGDYQIALNEWAAVRDELIPDQTEDQKEGK